MADKKLPPIHPGEILVGEFLKSMDISQYRLAMDMCRINRILDIRGAGSLGSNQGWYTPICRGPWCRGLGRDAVYQRSLRPQ